MVPEQVPIDADWPQLPPTAPMAMTARHSRNAITPDCRRRTRREQPRPSRRFGVCGGSFGLLARRKEAGETYQTLGCVAHKSRGAAICANDKTISERKVRTAVVGHLRDVRRARTGLRHSSTSSRVAIASCSTPLARGSVDGWPDCPPAAADRGNIVGPRHRARLEGPRRPPGDQEGKLAQLEVERATRLTSGPRSCPTLP